MATKLHDYDVSEHLRTPEEMAAYLEASIDESDGDAAFVAKAFGDIARAKGMAALPAKPASVGRACTRHCPRKAILSSTPS